MKHKCWHFNIIYWKLPFNTTVKSKNIYVHQSLGHLETNWCWTMQNYAYTIHPYRPNILRQREIWPGNFSVWNFGYSVSRSKIPGRKIACKGYYPVGLASRTMVIRSNRIFVARFYHFSVALSNLDFCKHWQALLIIICK